MVRPDLVGEASHPGVVLDALRGGAIFRLDGAILGVGGGLIALGEGAHEALGLGVALLGIFEGVGEANLVGIQEALRRHFNRHFGERPLWV